MDEAIQKALTELREEVKKAVPDQDKMERLNALLDTQEEKNQALVAANSQIETQGAELKSLRADLEAKSTNEGVIRERLDAAELELSRGRISNEAKLHFRDTEEFKALQEFCQLGGNMSQEAKQLLRTDIATEGGLLVPMELDTEITKKITEIDAIRSIARVRSISAKTLEIPIRNTIPVATFEGETETGTDSTSTYESESVTPFRQTFTSAITQDQLMDAAFDMQSEITEDAGEAFAFGEGNGFVVGTGVKQPLGFTVKPTIQANARDTAASGLLDPESIILLTGDLKVGYNPTYVLNRRTLAQIRTFRADAVSAADSAGGFLWQPGFQDRGNAGPEGPSASGNTINGFPYILANSMPDVAAGAFSIAFGDFRRGYTIVDRTGMTIIRDEFARKRDAIVEFTMNRWVTGRPTLDEAIKLLRILP